MLQEWEWDRQLTSGISTILGDPSQQNRDAYVESLLRGLRKQTLDPRILVNAEFGASGYYKI